MEHTTRTTTTRSKTPDTTTPTTAATTFSTTTSTSRKTSSTAATSATTATTATLATPSTPSTPSTPTILIAPGSPRVPRRGSISNLTATSTPPTIARRASLASMHTRRASVSATSTPTATRSYEVPLPSHIRIAFVGDTMLGRLIDQLFPVHNNEEEDRHHAIGLVYHKDRNALQQELKHKYVWGNMLPLLQSADLRVINLETSVTTHNGKWPNKAFNYRMHPDNLQSLKEANIDYVSLANNHTLDFSEKGMIDTMQQLDRFGIKWAGVGMNRRQAERPAVLEFNGRRILIFSFSDHPTYWAATETKPGINFVDVERYKHTDVVHIRNTVQNARNIYQPDLVIMSIHWGSNYCWVPPQKHTSFAHEMIDTCGIDIIHGHSSHHVQGIEFYKGKPIIYGCGDFVDDYAIDEDYRNDLGFLYLLDWDFNFKRALKIELVPTKINLFRVLECKGDRNEEDRKWLSRTMKVLSEPYQTDIEELENGHLILTPSRIY